MTIMRSRFGALAAGALLAAGTVLVPAAASALPQSGPSLTHADSPHCVIEAATMEWGVKTSFRTYITGSIANGSWEVSEGVEYVTPAFTEDNALDPKSDLFIWNTAAGEIESGLDGGSIDFTGTLFFSGHNGTLQLTVADPKIELDGEDAYLVLAMGEAVDGAPSEVRAAKIDLSAALETSETDFTVTQAPVRLTADGAAGFNGDDGYGSYTAGQEMDPLSLQAKITGCELGAVASPGISGDAESDSGEQVVAEDTVVTDATEASVPWLPIIAGGVALVIIVGAATMLLRGRKTGNATHEVTGEKPDATE